MPLLPGSKIGVIGGGQLGRMLILECRRMGYSSVVLDPDLHGPAAVVADRAMTPADIADFVKACDIATYEFEHVDIADVKMIEAQTRVCPSSRVLTIKQNRVSEKIYLRAIGLPVPGFHVFNDIRDMESIIHKTPLVVKMSTGGYDGKGLYIIKTEQDFRAICDVLKGEVIIEEFVPFAKEVSVICARNAEGDTVNFPVVQNVHENGILRYSLAPADISRKAAEKACELATGLAGALELVGLLSVEMFLLENDDLLINEFAPRPHNSGHYTMDACDISQFEMLIRAISGLPMTEPQLLCPAAMLNILGKGTSELDFSKIFSVPGVKLHLYGKKEARERRKMGHVNILAGTAADVMERLDRVIKAVS